jgi:eukaryotic-like serine/threonine-protein kinase
MEHDRWEKIERLYHAALERGPDAREAFLDEACWGDEALRREVASLIDYDDGPLCEGWQAHGQASAARS